MAEDSNPFSCPTYAAVQEPDPQASTLALPLHGGRVFPPSTSSTAPTSMTLAGCRCREQADRLLGFSSSSLSKRPCSWKWSERGKQDVMSPHLLCNHVADLRQEIFTQEFVELPLSKGSPLSEALCDLPPLLFRLAQQPPCPTARPLGPFKNMKGCYLHSSYD